MIQTTVVYLIHYPRCMTYTTLVYQIHPNYIEITIKIFITILTLSIRARARKPTRNGRS